MDYKLSNNHLPLSCCHQLINGICLESDSYRLGCFQIINEHIQIYSKLVVIVGVAIALFEVNCRDVACFFCFFINLTF